MLRRNLFDSMLPRSDVHVALEHQLSAIDGSFEVFAMCSALFWKSWQPLVLDFFHRLKHVNSSGLLVGRTRSVCDGASAHGLACVVGQNFSGKQDPMGMMERWRVIHHFLTRRQRIIFAGVDVRFIRPAEQVFAAVRADSPIADGAFESAVSWTHKIVESFTPDIVVAFPTTNMLRFVEAILAAYHAPLLDGLPPQLRLPELLRHPTHLKGPAQQDMLFDTFLSRLYGRQVAVRKVGMARNWLCCRAHWRARKQAKRLGTTPNLESCACLRSGVDAAADRDARIRLGSLSMTQATHGVVVTTPELTVLATDGGLTVSGYAPCSNCAKWRSPAAVHAIHCRGKNPACLDVERCACWPRGA